MTSNSAGYKLQFSCYFFISFELCHQDIFFFILFPMSISIETKSLRRVGVLFAWGLFPSCLISLFIHIITFFSGVLGWSSFMADFLFPLFFFSVPIISTYPYEFLQLTQLRVYFIRQIYNALIFSSWYM